MAFDGKGEKKEGDGRAKRSLLWSRLSGAAAAEGRGKEGKKRRDDSDRRSNIALLLIAEGLFRYAEARKRQKGGRGGKGKKEWTG